MKKQIWLTDEQQELVVELLRHSRHLMDHERGSLTTTMDLLCKSYCSKRVTEIITLIAGPQP